MAVYPIYQKSFWDSYTKTALRDAGEYLEETPSLEVLRTYEANHSINERYRPTIINYTDNRSIWDWSSHTTNLVNPGHTEYSTRETPVSSAEKKKEDEKAAARRNTFIGAALIIAFTFLARYTWKGYIRQQEAFQYTAGLKVAIGGLPEFPIKTSLANLIACQHRIDSIVLSRFKHSFNASLIALGSGIAIGLGGFMGDSRVSKIGFAGLIGAAAYVAWIFADYLQDRKEIRHHYELIAGDKKSHNGWANYILTNDLPNYFPDMNLLPSNPGNAYTYQPLYPQFYNEAYVNNAVPNFGTGGYGMNAPSAPPVDQS